MPIARLNRATLQLFADARIKEAKVLLQHEHWTGAYYLTGLGVECALKACLAHAVQQHDFPDKSFINRAYTHNLEDLARLDGELWVSLNDEMNTNATLRNNWSTVRQWDDEKRYFAVEEIEAVSMYEATTEAGSGILDWLRRRW
ncbi:MAG TPA: DNA-binding protein [Candidatus Binatia bacterium]|nr:DNA-binding protein [Candidatus Binatia bacterium]